MIYGSSTTALKISNEKMEDIIKIVKALEESRLLIKGISKTIKNDAKEEKGWFLPMLLGILAASILTKALSRRGVTRVAQNINAASSVN